MVSKFQAGTKKKREESKKNCIVVFGPDKEPNPNEKK